ncbi:cytochrome P450 3A21 [Caerostris darwini]|uniref:Cytochrome P450 3A21 n=1 Tax=Caerostris darwini TaxID=1538125 RepID=A0AAV4N0I6_9ARAC|nr:cytochrome P450 3A21 [Caerostris darwini]
MKSWGRYQKLGPIYGHYEGNKALISIADPTLLRDVLVKDFAFFSNRREVRTGDKVIDNLLSIIRGEDWKRVRTIITPTFTTGKIKRMLSIFKDCANTLVNNMKANAEQGKPANAKWLYGAFTMDTTTTRTTRSSRTPESSSHRAWASGSFYFKFLPAWQWIFFTLLACLFIVPVEIISSFTWLAPFLMRCLLIMQFPLIEMLSSLAVVAPRLMRWLGIGLFAKDATGFFKNTTLQIMEQRKRSGQVRNDFLQFMMDTAKEVAEEQNWEAAEKEKADIASNYNESDAGHQIFKAVTSKSLSMDELVAQCVIFFLAGYDTTASTLSFVTYQLAICQDVQDKLREEVDQAIKENNGVLTYEAVQSLKYLDNVISETLRMYPPAIRMERSAEADYQLGNTGITIPKGMIVTIPVFAMHRDPKLFPDPEKFDPDRFTQEEREKRDPYSYLPFGAGPRNCVGMRFALMEIKVCLSYVVANLRIKKCPQTQVPLEFNMGQQGLLQPKEILVGVEVREDSPLIQ